ncbi:MAG: ATP-binding protein [Candidatus Poribacteria bacterium]|nr:ATP-binding protein [Candidatus Poribacteria bacterium]
MSDKFKLELASAVREIDSKNAAHYVYYEIDNLHNSENPEDVRKRWIWELLQNAHDARRTDGITVEVRYNTREGDLVFLHNGRGFKASEIVHLIKAGTTKDEDDQETHGKFGRGFLTTHLLSPTVKIAGQLEDNSWFDFTLERNNKSKDTLAESLKQSLDAFEESISDYKPVIPDGFTTQFIFPICEVEAEKAVKAGIDVLEQCAPYVIVFNREFISININKPEKTKCFKFNGCSKLDESGIQQVTVAENEANMKYLLAQNEQQKTSVAVQIKSNGDKPVCLSVENIPKLFSAFPLVGTNLLSFPAVINNPNFLLPTARDTLQFDKNRDFIEEACNLLIKLIKYAAFECWNHVHRWTEIPYSDSLPEQLGPDWEECIKNLINRICQTPAVYTLSGEQKSPLKSILPVTEKKENVDVLWDLLKDWREYQGKLPKKDEAIGWYNGIKSWGVYEHKAFDGQKLAECIQDCSNLNVLQNMLQEGVCAVKWLDCFYNFLKMDELFNNAIHDYSFIPNQVGEFRKLSSLDRDKGIDPELKDISKILEDDIREDLYYVPLTSLEDVDNVKNLDNENIVGDLIENLENRANEKDQSYDRFKQASVRLFAWILCKGHYTRLHGFPVFAKSAETDPLDIINLPHPKPDDPPENERPLAPIPTWNNDLQDYHELFPRKHILADDFYDAVNAVTEEDLWQMLCEKKFIRKDVIIQYTSNVSFEAFQPRVPFKEKKVVHEAEKEITVSNIAFLTKKDIGIIDKVRKSPDLARKFWRFLTKYVVVHDSKGMEIVEDVPCTCEKTHHIYPSEWLEPVVTRSWIPIGRNKADVVTAENLVNLFMDSDWDPIGLNEHESIDKLLKAIDISYLDLILATFVDNNDRKVVDSIITEMLRKSNGNVNHLNQAIKYIDAVTSNEHLSEHVEELLEATEDELNQAREIMKHLQEDNKLFLQEFEKSKDRTRSISENRSIGKLVEESVEQILKEKLPDKKFDVKPVHKGADFEIVELEVTQGNKKLWIEVKSTRNDGDSQEVKISTLQAKKAAKEKENFLLCVVPIPESTKTDIETVRGSMRFIANIGNEVASLCDDLDRLEEVRVDITTDTISDVRLDVEKSKAGILVKESVWINSGFPLEKLVEYLMQITT